MLAKVVNDDVVLMDKRVDLKSFASKLAPTRLGGGSCSDLKQGGLLWTPPFFVQEEYAKQQ